MFQFLSLIKLTLIKSTKKRTYSILNIEASPLTAATISGTTQDCKDESPALQITFTDSNNTVNINASIETHYESLFRSRVCHL